MTGAAHIVVDVFIKYDKCVCVCVLVLFFICFFLLFPVVDNYMDDY